MAACNINTILADACANGFYDLSDRQVSLAIVALLRSGAGNPTASEVMSSAKCYKFMDDGMLNIALAQEACNVYGG